MKDSLFCKRTPALPHMLPLMLLCVLATFASACGDHTAGEGGKTGLPATPPATGISEAEREGARIFEQFRAHDTSKDSVTRMQVRLLEEDGQSRDIELRVSRKREADGRLLMFSEFLAPAAERDRNALITMRAQGEIEGTRYVQSNDSFATVRGATNEDSFFGLTVQELVDGQPEKYDFRLAGEETMNGTPVYRLEGKLKAGADSKFPRLVTRIAKDSYAVLSAEFYDNKNEMLRRITVTDLQQVAGYWTRMSWTIENPGKKKRLDFTVKEVQYDQNISPTVFTREHLKKSAFKPV